MKKIIVTGAHGLLGEAVCRLLKDYYEVRALSRLEVDLADSEALFAYLSSLEFDYLVNTAAMSGLESCLDRPEEAERVNVVAPQIMAEVCESKGAKMLQISTDYVLDGRECVIHKDDADSITRGSSIYSETKLLAENVVMEECDNSIVARVSWLFGHGRDTFVDQVLKSAMIGERKCYISDKFSVPNFSDDLVPAIREMLESSITGIVHLSNDAEPETWFSYAQKVIDIGGDIGLLNDVEGLIGQSKLDDIIFFRQERPRYTAMKPVRLSKDLKVQVRKWQLGIRDYLLKKHEKSLTSKNN